MLSELFGFGKGRGGVPLCLDRDGRNKTKNATEKIAVPLEENGQMRNFLKKL